MKTNPFLNEDLLKNGNLSTGWIPPLPDIRDFSVDQPEIIEISEKLGTSPEINKTISADKPEPKVFPNLPKKVDLRKWCSPIENQLGLGSCTAHAAVGIVEYFERKAWGKHADGSRLFVYKTTRNLMGVTGDTGAWLRTTMAAMAYCGLPPEKYWPYTDVDPDFDSEPTSFIYSMADNYEALKYFCHDPLNKTNKPALVLFTVKLYLARSIPSMFGFFGFENGGYQAGQYLPPYNTGEIFYPCNGDKVQWGHAIVAVGYDDDKKIKNPDCNVETTGALLIRNSWGTEWGQNGYGWLPYDFVLNRLAVDFWSLLGMNWVESGNFGLDL